jgi:hypothetical protein
MSHISLIGEASGSDHIPPDQIDHLRLVLSACFYIYNDNTADEVRR